MSPLIQNNTKWLYFLFPGLFLSLRFIFSKAKQRGFLILVSLTVKLIFFSMTPRHTSVWWHCGTHLVLDGRGRAVLCGGRRRPALQQGHGVGGEAQRRSLHLEHQLVDSEAPVSPHLPGSCGHGNHLEQRGEQGSCYYVEHFHFKNKRPKNGLKPANRFMAKRRVLDVDYFMISCHSKH